MTWNQLVQDNVLCYRRETGVLASLVFTLTFSPKHGDEPFEVPIFLLFPEDWNPLEGGRVETIVIVGGDDDVA